MYAMAPALIGTPQFEVTSVVCVIVNLAMDDTPTGLFMMTVVGSPKLVSTSKSLPLITHWTSDIFEITIFCDSHLNIDVTRLGDILFSACHTVCGKNNIAYSVVPYIFMSLSDDINE